MDLDDDFDPGDDGSSEDDTTEIDSSSSIDRPAYGQLTRSRSQNNSNEVILPIRPATSGSEDQHGILGHSGHAIAKLTRKRRRSSPSIQYADSDGLPLKRQKATLSSEYVEVLNHDIRHAAEANISEYWGDLKPSVLGQTYWAASEKEKFFSGLERLGRFDLAGIASRIGTKNEEEVGVYLDILEREDAARRADPSKRERVVRMLDIPLAAEVSQETCNSLEKMADDVSLRCEWQEDALEKKRWGGDRWLITPELARSFELRIRRDKEPSDMPFAEFFVTRNWLELSDRVFMNSVVPDYSWRSVSQEAPSMRASALQDLHGLAVEVTKRLVTATLVKATERVSAKSREHRTRGLVKNKDVREAAASLGLGENSRDFWARCARRLRLEVYRDGGLSESEKENVKGETAALDDTSDSAGSPVNCDDDDDDDDDEGQDFMTYREVEAALGIHATSAIHREDESDTDDINDLSEDSSLHLPESSPEESTRDDEGIQHPGQRRNTPADAVEIVPGSPGDERAEEEGNDIDPAVVDRDLHEAIQYTDIPYSGTARGRDAIRRRIEIEHRLEAQCARFDAVFDRAEERRLRRLLVVRGGDVGGGGSGNGSGSGSGDKITEIDSAPHPPSGAGGGGQSGPLLETPSSWRDVLNYPAEWEVTRARGGPSIS